MSHRKIEHLNDNRIIYRRLPVLDKPSHSFDWGYYFEDGTYEFYDLFRSKALINTYKSLRWHLRVLWYLNPDLKETFGYDSSLASRWQVQFGLRYIF